MVIPPKCLTRLAASVPVVPAIARAVAKRLPMPIGSLFYRAQDQAAKPSAGVVVNINLYSAESPAGTVGHDLPDDYSGPWWGLEGYDTA